MIKLINNFLESVKRKDRLAQIERLRNSFSIKERDGKLWIMHNEIAILKMETFSSTSEVVRILEETKDHAVEYAFGVKKEREEVDARAVNNPFYVKPELKVTPV